MSHVMKWSDQHHTATCTCGLLLIVSSSREQAERCHAEHLQAEQLHPTPPATVWLAKVNRRTFSGFHQPTAAIKGA